MTTVMFALLSIVSLTGAMQVVRSTDLVHVVLWLAVTLLGTAGLYVTLDAGFLAAIQVLLYTGGVITLMLFSVMLARRMGGAVPAGGWGGNTRAGLVVVVLVGLVGFVVFGARVAAAPAGTPPLSTARLGEVLMSDLGLPFEVLSMLLLAAMVGAIVLSRRKDA